MVFVVLVVISLVFFVFVIVVLVVVAVVVVETLLTSVLLLLVSMVVFFFCGHTQPSHSERLSYGLRNILVRNSECIRTSELILACAGRLSLRAPTQI